MIVSLINGRAIAMAPAGTLPGGVVGQFSFSRLVELLRAAGELKPHETITHFEIKVDEPVIRYRVETEHKPGVSRG